MSESVQGVAVEVNGRPRPCCAQVELDLKRPRGRLRSESPHRRAVQRQTRLTSHALGRRRRTLQRLRPLRRGSSECVQRKRVQRGGGGVAGSVALSLSRRPVEDRLQLLRSLFRSGPSHFLQR
jgi:hypothetical protein